MKRFLCLILIAVLLFGTVALVACKRDKLKQAAKNANNYTIVCSYDEKSHILSATQQVEVTNNSNNAFSCIKFHLYANQYREDAKNCVVPNTYKAYAYPNGDSFGNISIESALVDDVAVAYAIEGEDMDILSVPLQEELFPNQTATIELTYEIQLANIKHRLGYAENTTNLGNFFPILCHVDNDNYTTSPYYNVGDPFVSDVANFDVSITVRENFTVASTGNLVDTSTTSTGYVCYKYNADACRDFALVLSDKYKKLSKTVGDTTVNYYYFSDSSAENSLAVAVDCLTYFNQHVGNYPYKQYSVCETDFCYGGMEYPCLSMVTSGSKQYVEAIVHETAHQYFYSVVGNDQIEYPWMDEGLAEFVTYLYLDYADHTPLAKNIKANTKTYTTYVDVLNHYYNDVDRTLRPIYKYKNDKEYVIFTYLKGSLLFDTLYQTMGEQKFWSALKQYYNNYQYAMATPLAMSQCFVNKGGKEIQSIFDAFIDGKEIIGSIAN